MNQTDAFVMGQHLPKFGNLQVISYLVTTHHDFTRHIMEEISELIYLARREMVNPPEELSELSAMWQQYHQGMLEHLREEEEILFPWIERQGQTAEAGAVVDDQIKHMLVEHKHHEESMERVKMLADQLSENGGYIPVLARLAYKLKQLNTDLKEHMEIETGLLFPRMQGKS